MTCPSCGSTMPDQANFCPNCGAKAVAGDAPGGLSGDTTKVIPVVTDSRPVSSATEAGTGEMSVEAQAAAQSLSAGSGMLVVERGPDAGARYLLDTDVVTAGRHPSSDIFLDDITVSRNHAEFTRGGDGWTITDKGSLNGTYVNRTLVDGTAPLRRNDEVQIGKFRMVFLVGENGR